MRLRCPYCGAPLVKTPEGYYVCENGHVVEEEEIVYQLRAYDRDEFMRRNHHTVVAAILHAQAGSRPSDRTLWLKTLTASIRNARDRRRYDVRKRITECAPRLGLDEEISAYAAGVVDRAIAKDVRASGSVLAAAALYIAARHYGIDIDDEQFSEVCGVKNVVRHASKLAGLLGMKLYVDYRLATKRAAARLVQQLGLKPIVEALAVRIIEAYIKATVKRPYPRVLAAAAVYIAGHIVGVNVTYPMLTRAVNATDAALRNIIHDILDKLYIEVRL